MYFVGAGFESTSAHLLFTAARLELIAFARQILITCTLIKHQVSRVKSAVLFT